MNPQRFGAGGGSGGGRGRSSFGAAASASAAAADYYGSPIPSSSTGNFPIPGSTLGPYFSIGQLGKGTFASIHRCINLAYHHNYHDEPLQEQLPERKQVDALPLPSLPQCAIDNPRRLVAAKVDNGGFNVLSGESAILEYLSETMPPGMVPMYQGHLAAEVVTPVTATATTEAASATSTAPTANLSKELSSMPSKNRSGTVINALFMEYLPGRDLGQIREWWTRQRQQQDRASNEGTTATEDRPNKRRIAIEDAVQLCTYILHLLKNMHEVGIVHRDVKASNVVKLDGRSSTNMDFAVVDFGLSRQVTAAATMPDKEKDVHHVWTGREFMRSSKENAREQKLNQGKDVTTETGLVTVAGTDEDEDVSSVSSTNPRIQPKAYYRRERPTAEFRGTSMYASPRVHQLRDYCARDDMWSLMYVFCELVSGGLPWMEFALNRRRDDCQLLKERIHGLVTRTSNTNDEVDGLENFHHHSAQTNPSNSSMLLMGGDYYVALYKRNRGQVEVGDDGNVDESIILPEPLAMSKDLKKTMALDAVFDHLKRLSFTDVPDYETIRISMEAFLDDQHENSAAKEERKQVSRIDWNQVAANYTSNNNGGVGCIDESSRPTAQPLWGSTSLTLNSDINIGCKVPTWEIEKSPGSGTINGPTDSFADRDDDPVDWMLFVEAEGKILDDKTMYQSLDGEEADLVRLPLEMRYRIAQMEFHARHYRTIATHIALRDWLRVALPLLYGEWNSKQFEKGGHRTNDDGYRREFFVRLIDKCLDCAKPFNGFCHISCYYETVDRLDDGRDDDEYTTSNEHEGLEPHTDGDGTAPHTKRRRISDQRKCQQFRRRRVVTTNVKSPPSIGLPTEAVDLVLVSKVMFGLKMTKKAEEKLSRAPPPRLSFGSF